MSLVASDDAGLRPTQSPSEGTAELIDLEMRGIVQGCYTEAVRLLSTHRHQLDALASALLRAESLDELDILRATGLQSRAQLDLDKGPSSSGGRVEPQTRGMIRPAS
jgi:ATP-dependent Zn protease